MPEKEISTSEIPQKLDSRQMKWLQFITSGKCCIATGCELLQISRFNSMIEMSECKTEDRPIAL
jgi:hypothetical protein